jgi:hypothetical protein
MRTNITASMRRTRVGVVVRNAGGGQACFRRSRIAPGRALVSHVIGRGPGAAPSSGFGETDYSARRASTGSTDEARRDGI